MSSPTGSLTDAARHIFLAALDAVRPEQLIGRFDLEAALERPIGDFERVIVLGAGKASAGMACALERRLRAAIHAGEVVVPEGYEAGPMPRRIEVIRGGHPVPNAAGEAAAARALEQARGAGADDLIIALISGGGSSLWSLFAEGVTLEDARMTFNLLLRSGAPIHELNTVRRHISRIGGGRLAAAAHPARLIALVISDVPGDSPADIASGPTVADPTTFDEAREILDRYGLWGSLPESVQDRLGHGGRDQASETPKPGDPRLACATTHLIGRNADAVEAAATAARAQGFDVRTVTTPIIGEARVVGRQLALKLLESHAGTPVALIQGGETTVIVRGDGLGGRNQELALAAALELDGRPGFALLSGGTDGVDGPTDAAGAAVDHRTVTAARKAGFDPARALERNDAHPLLAAAGALVRTGPTHTNVMDLMVGLSRPGEKA